VVELDELLLELVPVVVEVVLLSEEVSVVLDEDSFKVSDDVLLVVVSVPCFSLNDGSKKDGLELLLLLAPPV